MASKVYTEESREFYDAALVYWRCVKHDGDGSTTAALAGMKMMALAVEAHQLGASKGELELLQSTARIIVERTEANDGNQ